MSDNSIVVLGLVSLIVVVVVFGPLLSIWALNTLFSVGIGYSIKTWFAALVLGGVVGGRMVKSGK